MNTGRTKNNRSPNALLLSIKPRFADAIFSGEKTFELRRVRPKVEAGSLVLVYVTTPRCALEGAFEVKAVHEDSPKRLWSRIGTECGVTKSEFTTYFSGADLGYAIEIARSWILDDQVSLKAMRDCSIRPPQSYHYLDGQQLAMLL